MKGVREFIIRNWYVIIVGLWLMGKAISGAYEFRGHTGIGGEFLVLFVILLGASTIRGIVEQVVGILGGDR